MNSIQTKGVHLALLAAFISGVSIFINKFAVSSISSPLVFTTTKNLLVGILIICFFLITKKWQLINKLNKKNLIYLFLIGIIGGSIPFYLFFTGLSQIPAVNAAILQKTLVLWVAVLAIPLLKEKLSKLQIIAITLLFLSNFIIGGFKGFQLSTGEVLVFIATLFWAVETILAKKVLPGIDSDILILARMLFGGLILLGATLLTSPAGFYQITGLSTTQWFWIILTALTLLAYIMSWYRALKLAPAITVTSILVASTLITNILSAIFITHVWNQLMGVQAIFIILGVGLLYISVAKNPSILLSSKKIN
ncbi:MAG: DMT family transporter [Candidatus Daviesbacteria bacterium]|nr:DMT family transporter [Candidatus Daviesbacteria bacterium]